MKTELLVIQHATRCQACFGGKCSCGAETQAKVTIRQIAEWLDFEMDDAPLGHRLERIEKCLQELKSMG